jgi:hypothetical protein
MATFDSILRDELTANSRNVHLNVMRASSLDHALTNLTGAIRQVEAVLAEMRAEHDPLAVYIFKCSPSIPAHVRYKERQTSGNGCSSELAASLRPLACSASPIPSESGEMHDCALVRVIDEPC